MAMDTRQKRMSAIAPASPWRGPRADATEPGFTQGNRQAACCMYSGILAEALAAAAVGPHARTGESGLSGGTWSDPQPWWWN